MHEQAPLDGRERSLVCRVVATHREVLELPPVHQARMQDESKLTVSIAAENRRQSRVLVQQQEQPAALALQDGGHAAQSGTAVASASDWLSSFGAKDPIDATSPSGSVQAVAARSSEARSSTVPLSEHMFLKFYKSLPRGRRGKGRVHGASKKFASEL